MAPEDSVSARDAQISHVLSRYAHAIDDGDVASVLACLSEDGTISYEGGKISLLGHAAIRDYLTGMLVGPSTHLISNTMVDGDIVRASAIVCVTRQAGVVQVRGVQYRANCVRIGDTWKFSRLEHRPIWQFTAPNEG